MIKIIITIVESIHNENYIISSAWRSNFKVKLVFFHPNFEHWLKPISTADEKTGWTYIWKEIMMSSWLKGSHWQ